MPLLDRLQRPGPKRLLALDGGGIRGALSTGFLEHIEALLRERHGRPDMVLADYFDLIGGTSTGAIIAAGLAIGMSAEEIREAYLELGGKAFTGTFVLRRHRARYRTEPLEEQLQKFFGERTLDDPAIRTGLCIVTKRADTNSVWPLLNHPEGRFFEENRRLPLKDAVRASTAAPTYFMPEKLRVGTETGAFIDGGVSMANNPALQLFLIATLRGFPFRWPVGEDRLLLVSVGTGYWNTRQSVDEVLDNWLLNWAAELPDRFMDDAGWQNQLMLQYLSRSPTAAVIDREVGDLGDDLLTPEPALSYLRYTVPLEKEPLVDLGFDGATADLDRLRDMSEPENRFVLADIGRRAAAQLVQDGHFPATFDMC